VTLVVQFSHLRHDARPNRAIAIRVVVFMVLFSYCFYYTLYGRSAN